MRLIYFDYAATTPVDRRVLKAMMPFFTDSFGNPASLHSYGQTALSGLEESRQTIGQYINADPGEIIFTSSATESNNLAIKGVAFANQFKKNHIITTLVEHDCIIESSLYLKTQGFEVTFLPVDKYGLINLNDLKKAIKKNTLLVSVIHGNNEIGSIHDIATIGQICHDHKIYFHTDASQSIGKINIDVKKMNIDLLTGSSHKIYGPKGVALLYIKKGVLIDPIIHGGGQENNRRSSTVNVAGIVGLAKAIELLKDSGKENKRLIKLRDYLINQILSTIKDTHLNGHSSNRLSNNINISFYGVEGEALMLELDSYGIAVSTGSACSSKTLEPSHVLLATGLSPVQAHGSLRISLGRFTTQKEVDYLLKILPEVVKKLRAMSPVYH